MRFKTRLRPEKVSQLLHICQVLEKVDRSCVVHLCAADDDQVRLVMHGDAAAGPATYTVLKRSDWFESYRIESQNANQIGLELDMNNFMRALRSATTADYVLVKLAKKGLPVLTFEISTPLGPILQDIPVSVLSAVRLAELLEPRPPETVGFALPPLPKLHLLVDRMKALNSLLRINANLQNNKATLSLSVRTDMVSVSATFADLEVAGYDLNDSEVQRETSEHVSVDALVDVRLFSRCLHGQHVNPQHALCFIHSSCVMLYLALPHDVTISYYVPHRSAPI